MAVVGLVIDGSILLTERRHAQNVADSAALSAVMDLMQNKGILQARASALEYAKNQGYTNDGTTSTVTVNIPPLSGPHLADPDFVEVLVSYRQKTSFIQAYSGTNTSQVGARAVAGIVRAEPNVNALVALAPSGDGALTIRGSGTLTVTGAPVQANSDSPKAMLIMGTALGQGQGWLVKGGWGSVAYTPLGAGGSGSGPLFTPPPTTGAAPIADPLRNMAPPSANGMASYSAVSVTTGTTTISPGIYTGGISVSGSGSLTLQPGVYIIQGGGFSAKDTASLTALGVTIYNSGTPLTFGPINITSQITSFSPPINGPTQGLMIFQDSANTQPAVVKQPQATGQMQGTFYLPSAQLTLDGNGGAYGRNIQLVASSFLFITDHTTGNADITIPYDATKYARPPEIYLVE
jgi:Flp pilus assembly protein TadG